MTNAQRTLKFLQVVDPKTKQDILRHIAVEYQISTDEAYTEVTDQEADHLLDYLSGSLRTAASVLMQASGLRGF